MPKYLSISISHTSSYTHLQSFGVAGIMVKYICHEQVLSCNSQGPSFTSAAYRIGDRLSRAEKVDLIGLSVFGRTSGRATSVVRR